MKEKYRVNFDVLDTYSGDDFRDIIQSIGIYVNAVETAGLFVNPLVLLAMLGITEVKDEKEEKEVTPFV